MMSNFVPQAKLLAMTVDAAELAEVDAQLAQIDADVQTCEAKYAEVRAWLGPKCAGCARW